MFKADTFTYVSISLYRLNLQTSDMLHIHTLEISNFNQYIILGYFRTESFVQSLVGTIV